MFFFNFCIEFHFSNCFAMSPNLLSTYQLLCFFFTFCIECNSNFLFFTFCIEFHFYKCFAMSPNLLSTYQLCFFLLFELSVTLTFFFSLFALNFTFISVLRCLQIYYQPINSVFFTFCTEFNLKFVFFFTFFIEFNFSNCCAMSPNLLSTYQLCFLFYFLH